VEYNPHSQHFLLVDRVLQQVVLQQPGSGSRASSEQGSLRDLNTDPTKVPYLTSHPTNSRAR
jgi:hypothetical protein